MADIKPELRSIGIRADLPKIDVKPVLSAITSRPHAVIKSDEGWRAGIPTKDISIKPSENVYEVPKSSDLPITVGEKGTGVPRTELARELYDTRNQINILKDKMKDDNKFKADPEAIDLMKKNNAIVDQLRGRGWSEETIRGLVNVIAEERMEVAKKEEKAVVEGTVESQAIQAVNIGLVDLGRFVRGVEKMKVDPGVLEEEKKRVKETLIPEWEKLEFFKDLSDAKKIDGILSKYGIQRAKPLQGSPA